MARKKQNRQNFIRRQSSKYIKNNKGNLSVIGNEENKYRNTISNFNFNQDSNSDLVDYNNAEKSAT